MRPTSEQQVEALKSGSVPAAEEVRPGIYALAFDMPGMQPPYAYVYALIPGLSDGQGVVHHAGDSQSREVHLIDAALDTDENWDALGGALAALDRDITDVASVTITHLHGDHTGLAWRIREASGAVVRMHEREAADLQSRARFGVNVEPENPNAETASSAARERLDAWGVPADVRDGLLGIASARGDLLPSGEVDEAVADGDPIDFGAWQGRAIHTPGHTNGHLCIAIDTEQLLFTGDHLMPVTSSGLALGGERSADPLGEYIASLDRLTEYSEFEVLPGHDFRFSGLVDRTSAIRTHHDARTRQVGEILAGAEERGEQLSLWQVASQVSWTGGFENLAGVSLLSALAQTEMHIDRVRAARP